MSCDTEVVRLDTSCYRAVVTQDFMNFQVSKGDLFVSELLELPFKTPTKPRILLKFFQVSLF